LTFDLIVIILLSELMDSPNHFYDGNIIIPLPQIVHKQELLDLKLLLTRIFYDVA